jgi:putative two-component system response regulator
MNIYAEALEPKNNTILVVDDNAMYLEAVRDFLIAQGYQVLTASSGDSALKIISTILPDLVLLDAVMPEKDGFEVCARLKSQDHTRFIPVVMVTSLSESKDKVRGIEAGVDDFISKPFVAEEMKARLRSLLRLKHITEQLDSAEDIILSLASATEAKDPYTEGHTERVGNYCSLLGRAISLAYRDLRALEMGGILHDIGKIGILDVILNKNGKLTSEEYEKMKLHPAIGYKIIQPLRSFSPVLPIVRHHHERFDGKGYPDGLKGKNIPLLARITTVADVYDAITTDRPYRKAMPPEKAQQTMLKMSGTHLDPELVKIFLGLVAKGGKD